MDEYIQVQAGAGIPAIFEAEGEAGFRQRERAALSQLLKQPGGVVALGGGALLDPQNRALAEASGIVLCLVASMETLLKRLRLDLTSRPLLSNQSEISSNDPQSTTSAQKLASLLTARAAHYASFPVRLDVNQISLAEAAWQAQVRLGRFRISGMGNAYDVCVLGGGLNALADLLQAHGLNSPLGMVCDANVAEIYADKVFESLASAGYAACPVTIQAGEAYKTLATVQDLWSGFLNAGLERSSTVIAIGGGVTGDLAGFAAATYLRGVRWVNIPTSLLAMIDASLGGKTGADLPQGKNLVGAFYPPTLVLADPAVLATLPEPEIRSGLAEVIKHGIIGDEYLFDCCAQGWGAILERMEEIVRRAMAVKIQVIQTDPYEQGQRAALNLGHTLGHGLELASDYRLRHGEAVAIGIVAAARLSERLGLAEAGLAQRIARTLSRVGLPVEIPDGLDREKILAAMQVDKKRKDGKVRLALPIRIGEVRVGIAIDDLQELLIS